ncbi:alpha/beta fold hydrolase [Brevibacillus sp. 179-C9.3 HS]|uniref:alpha/beta fold hydrolase n=1 Tax=unclassified Brevibacillus TaxID=2684853 RepID=UPI0039A123E9
MKKFSVHTNGIKIMVHQYSDSGIPVIFLHFIRGNAAVWNGVIPYFLNHYTAIAIDLRGHGESDQPETDYEISTFANDLLGVLDELNFGVVHLVGSSLGCYVATYFAAKYPTRVLSIVHSDGAMQNHSGTNGKFADKKEIFLEKLREPDIVFSSAEDYIHYEKARRSPWNRVIEKAVTDGWANSMREQKDGQLSPYTTNETFIQIMGSLYDLKLERLYEKLSCPILFLPAAIHRNFDEKN